MANTESPPRRKKLSSTSICCSGILRTSDQAARRIPAGPLSFAVFALLAHACCRPLVSCLRSSAERLVASRLRQSRSTCPSESSGMLSTMMYALGIMYDGSESRINLSSRLVAAARSAETVAQIVVWQLCALTAPQISSLGSDNRVSASSSNGSCSMKRTDPTVGCWVPVDGW